VGDFYRQGGLLEQLRRELAAMRSFIARVKTILVGRHTSALSTLIAAESLGAPCAWLALSPCRYARQKRQLINVRNGLGAELDAIRAESGLAPMTRWAGWFELPDLLIGAWPRWFDEAGDPSPARVRLTGFARSDGGAAAGDPMTAGGIAAGPPTTDGGAAAGDPMTAGGIAAGPSTADGGAAAGDPVMAAAMRPAIPSRAVGRRRF